jgi:hypothetical protein
VTKAAYPIGFWNHVSAERQGPETEEGFGARHAEFSELTKWFMPGQLEPYRVEVQT